MKKTIILLSVLFLDLVNLTMSTSSWNKEYFRLSSGIANLNLNYSGNEPYTMTLSQTQESSYPPRWPLDYGQTNKQLHEYTIAKKSSGTTIIFDCAYGISWEFSPTTGLMGELGGTVGKVSNFIDGSSADTTQISFMAGVFFITNHLFVFLPWAEQVLAVVFLDTLIRSKNCKMATQYI